MGRKRRGGCRRRRLSRLLRYPHILLFLVLLLLVSGTGLGWLCGIAKSSNRLLDWRGKERESI